MSVGVGEDWFFPQVIEEIDEVVRNASAQIRKKSSTEAMLTNATEIVFTGMHSACRRKKESSFPALQVVKTETFACIICKFVFQFDLQSA